MSGTQFGIFSVGDIAPDPATGRALAVENYALLRSPTTVFAAPEDWGGATIPSTLADRVMKAAEELAARMARQGDPPPRDPYAPIPFDTLLPRA